MTVYEPEEDSFLLAEQVRELASGTVLDMCSGSGIQAENATKAEKIVCADINEEAVALLREKGYHAVKSDLFSKIKEKFDTIIFNPPYLPFDKNEPVDSAMNTAGGKYGSELIERFLKDAKKHLNSNGKIIMVFSSITPGVKEMVKKYGYANKKLAEKKLFQETIYVVMLW
jgi:release factor glutamine methyltransferase